MSVAAIHRVSAVPFPVRLAALICGVLVMRWLWLSHHIANGPILCPFRLISGHPCPLCGSTRAVSALCAGDIRSAWYLNPFGVSLSLVTALMVLSPDFAADLRDRSQRLGSRLTLWSSACVSVVSFCAIWVWNVSRW
jgi:hypothetical protein